MPLPQTQLNEPGVINTNEDQRLVVATQIGVRGTFRINISGVLI